MGAITSKDIFKMLRMRHRKATSNKTNHANNTLKQRRAIRAGAQTVNHNYIGPSTTINNGNNASIGAFRNGDGGGEYEATLSSGKEEEGEEEDGGDAVFVTHHQEQRVKSRGMIRQVKGKRKRSGKETDDDVEIVETESEKEGDEKSSAERTGSVILSLHRRGYYYYTCNYH